jgi:preprotein translocase subunit SecA
MLPTPEESDNGSAGGNGSRSGSRSGAKAQVKRPNTPDPDSLAPIVKQQHEKVGRNDPCWCGSGKKYKFCHGAA